jgi:REP-associated tyrosine transposase
MARVVVEGVPHHITQRGNNRQDVFLVDEDRRSYIQTLRDKCQQHGVALLGYCLMTNYVHLIGIPPQATSLALALGQARWRYAMRFQQRYGRSGHLWQRRFYSCPFGPRRLVTALAYVDLNPVRAGLVGEAVQYPWSMLPSLRVATPPVALAYLPQWPRSWSGRAPT